jgi:hypothetical protein
MSDGDPTIHVVPQIACANCGQVLDAADKYCRECGLPTLRRAQIQHAVPIRASDAAVIGRETLANYEPLPFERVADVGAEPDTALNTGSVLRATSPTLATQLAASTALMVLLTLALLAAGVLLLVLAFWS